MSLDGTRLLETKAKLFRALGDPSRLAVLEVLRDGPKCVTCVDAPYPPLQLWLLNFGFPARGLT